MYESFLGVTNMAFGFLPLIKSGHAFFIASLAMRFPRLFGRFFGNSLFCGGRGLTAVGEAAMNSAVLPLARKRGGLGRYFIRIAKINIYSPASFRECSVLSWMETMNGVGTTFGPFIGN